MTKFRAAWAGGAFLALLAAFPSAGHAFQPTDEQRAACTSDAIRFCASYFGNMDGIAACLARNKSKLSSAKCRSFLQQAGL